MQKPDGEKAWECFQQKTLCVSCSFEQDCACESCMLVGGGRGGVGAVNLVIVSITVQDSSGTEFEDKEYKYYVESVSLIFMKPQ